MIKDLAAEVKLHKGEADILRKDTKIHKQTIDLLEKQVEKLKHYAANNNEVVVLHNELKRKELKMSSIKKKKNELKSHKN